MKTLKQLRDELMVATPEEAEHIRKQIDLIHKEMKEHSDIHELRISASTIVLPSK